MAHLPTNRLPHFTQQIIEGFAFNGHFDAQLVGHFLEATGLIPPPTAHGRKLVTFPERFLLELAGVLRLAWWEHVGLAERLPTHLPKAAEALADLFQRWSTGVPDQETAPVPPLLQQVLNTWFCHFAWSGLEELHADVALGVPEEQEWLEALADFLWEHRHGGQTGE